MEQVLLRLFQAATVVVVATVTGAIFFISFQSLVRRLNGLVQLGQSLPSLA